MKIEFPKTDVIGCKFLGFDGRQYPYLEQPWMDIPDERRLVDRKQYTYRCIPGLASTLTVGDIVVVSCKTGFQVCVVTELNIIAPDNSKLAYAITKVDLDGYRAMLQQENEKRRLKKLLDAKKAELEKSAVYEMLAAKDPGFAELLEAFKSLGGTLT